jgi:putative ABC transport system permease protein
MGDPRSRLALRDLLDEAVVGVVGRPLRSALTALGTVLGVGTLVAIIGLTSTTAAQVGSEFDILRSAEVQVKDAGTSLTWAFPADAEARAARLNGVVASGLTWTPRLARPTVAGSALPTDRGIELPVVAATPGVFAATGSTVRSGRFWDGFVERTGQPVAVIGSTVADRLGIGNLALRPAVFVDGTGFTVVGILAHSERMPALSLSVVVPSSTAAARWGAPAREDSGASMLVVTRVGAAQQVAGEVALALRPDDPGAFGVVPPPDPQGLRHAVDQQLRMLLLFLGGISLLVGGVGIANTTLVSVMERTPEIGLRRAVGARAVHIAAQFLAESAMLGLLGGVLGCVAGLGIVLMVSLLNSWTPVLAPGVALGAPLAGLAIGALAGLYPAVRAARIEPVEALRR